MDAEDKIIKDLKNKFIQKIYEDVWNNLNISNNKKQLKTKTIEMEINILFETTEYSSIPDYTKNSHNKFTITDKALIIWFCDDNGHILTHTEISIEDAKKLSKLLLTI